MSHMITLSPIDGTGYHSGLGSMGGGGMSTVKSFAFFLLFVGLVLIAVGYMQSETRSQPPRVEFRYVPRTFEQEQDAPVPIMSVFGSMFAERDPWQKYRFFADLHPWERYGINSRVVHPYHQTFSGVGRGVGQHVLG